MGLSNASSLRNEMAHEQDDKSMMDKMKEKVHSGMEKACRYLDVSISPMLLVGQEYLWRPRRQGVTFLRFEDRIRQ